MKDKRKTVIVEYKDRKNKRNAIKMGKHSMSRVIHEVRTRNVRVVFPLALDQKPQEDLQWNVGKLYD